jgi:hypothetical protein
MSCPDCVKGNILPGEPTGEYLTKSYGGADAYLAAAPAGSNAGGRAVVILTDIFGLPMKNPRIIADRLAKELECDVWVPDYFAGTYMHFPRQSSAAISDFECIRESTDETRGAQTSRDSWPEIICLGSTWLCLAYYQTHSTTDCQQSFSRRRKSHYCALFAKLTPP